MHQMWVMGIIPPSADSSTSGAALAGVAVATVDSVGRRPLLLVGVSGIVASLLVLGSVGAGLLPVGQDALAWTNLIALLAYVGCYQVSPWARVCYG